MTVATEVLSLQFFLPESYTEGEPGNGGVLPGDTISQEGCRMDLEKTVDMALREAQRAVDYTEILNTFSAHLYSMHAGDPRWELENIWAKERDDIVYVSAVGRSAVEAYYRDATERMKKEKLALAHAKWPEVSLEDKNLGIGDMVAKASASPFVVIADDGMSAHGVWFVPGISSELDETGNVRANYFQEKNAVDFIKENGAWKILRLDIYVDFQTPITAITFDPEAYDFDVPEGPYPPAYGPKRVAGFFPQLPQAYETWSDDISVYRRGAQR